MVVTAYQSASGWMNLFTPTSAIVMEGLALSRVRYDLFLKFVAPLLGILLILTCLFMLLGVAVLALGGAVRWLETTRSPGHATRPAYRHGRKGQILLAVAGLASVVLASARDTGQ